MKKVINFIVQAIDARDLIGATGLGFLFYGTYQVAPPAAFVVVGGVLTLVAVRGV